MRFQKLKRLIWIGLCPAAGLIFVACNKTDASKSPGETMPLTRLDWNLKILVEAYQKSGHANPKWDVPAERALTEYANARSQTTESNENWGAIISNNCSAALEAGCDDPMIHLLHVRFGMDQTGSRQSFAEAFRVAALDMEASPYPDILKFDAWLREGRQAIYTYGYGTNIPVEVARLEIWPHAETNLLAALSDRTMPPEEAYNACHALLEEWKGNADHYAELYHSMEKRFPGPWKNEPVILLLKGEACIEMAWHARGSGYANTVTGAGWKLFRERLAAAEAALTKAWQLNAHDPRIAVKMMKVELGQGQGRDRMELWFLRAMELDPNDYDACNSKLWYFEPKWYGSVSDMLAFGRECVQNQQWGGHVPLILLDAHLAIQQEFADPAEKTNYWTQPKVWLDLKDAFDRFFELNPGETSWYHNYAWFAWQAGQWATLNNLIPKLAPVNYDYFGGKDKFETMLTLAKEHAGETKAKD